MKRILVTKVLETGYGVGVIPEMEKPKERVDAIVNKYYEYEFEDWKANLASLPTFLIHPSLNPKEGGWIESYTEGYEYKHPMENESMWTLYSGPLDYDGDLDRRIVLLPLLEKKIDDDGQLSRIISNIIMENNNPTATAKILDLVEEHYSEGNTPASEVGMEENRSHIFPTQEKPGLDLVMVELNDLLGAKSLDAHDLIMKIMMDAGFDRNNKKMREMLCKMFLYSYKKFKWKSPPSLQESEKGMKWTDQDMIDFHNFIFRHENQFLHMGEYLKQFNESQDTAKQSK